MKTEITTPKAFQPVTIALTFETQAELDALRNILNVGQIVREAERVHGVTDDVFRQIRQALDLSGAKATQFHVFFNGLKDEMEQALAFK